MQTPFRTTLFGLAAFAGSALVPGVASACGGFFCNQSQPVNQAAEGIIFADNGDGTVTAVIQIRYEGPSTKFSWLLPISSAPQKPEDVGVASNLALQRLQAATNPNYTLTTRIEGTCREQDFRGGGNASGGSASAGPPLTVGGGDNGGVTVEASGSVGPYDWDVIAVDASLVDPAAAAVKWLTAHEFDVPSEAPKLLGDYLQQGLHLLAVKLTKGADTGSIRPIVITYQGTKPSIPVKLTAVAANDDMGVLTWVLGNARAVPQNYLSLELNEARINWFNASSNYNSVVIAAADDAGGQGFVTEFAGATSTLKNVVWTTSDDANWTSFSQGLYQSFSEFFQRAYGQYGQYDGFWDATQAAVTLPSGLAFADFKLCPNCYADQITFTPTAYLNELKAMVIDPIKLVQNLIDAHPELTRMYTTLSADEMTLDPLFTFNPDLPDVSNLHTADRVIECNSGVYQYEAPWRIELPQGGVIRGTGATVGVWPDFGTLAPNLRITQSAASGTGKVLEDNSATIGTALASYNASVKNGTAGTGATAGTSGSGATGGGGSGNMLGSEGGSGGTAGLKSGGGGGCNVGHGSRPLGALVALSAFGAILVRRRRHAAIRGR